MDEFEQELKQDFLTEAVDLLSDAESAFLRLDSDAGDPELMNEIFRLAHNLKGTSKAVGFDQLSELTHKAENLILKIKEGEIGISDQVVSTLLEFKDTVDGMINELKDDLEKVFDVDAIQKKIDKMVSGELEDNQNLEPEPLVEESAEVLEEVTSGEDKKFDELQEVVSESIDESFSSEKENTLEQIPDASLFQDVIAEPEVQPEVLQKEEVQAEAERSSEPAAKGQKKESVDSDETIRVKLSRINTINNVV
ncbi:MAG: hypothetical protein CL678_12515 [Bdellovibrionaceae bacterium]|nr:hypothetical protein [Pseudobdellovibrionaceae bacterium]